METHKHPKSFGLVMPVIGCAVVCLAVWTLLGMSPHQTDRGVTTAGGHLGKRPADTPLSSPSPSSGSVPTGSQNGQHRDLARSTPAETTHDPPSAPDEQLRRLAIGTWEDDYQGKRMMRLRQDGTATMVVELSGMKATLLASRLQFEMVWSIQDGRLKKRTLGGEPAAKVDLILKMLGDRVDEKILELTTDRLLLLDADGETEYDWRRVR